MQSQKKASFYCSFYNMFICYDNRFVLISASVEAVEKACTGSNFSTSKVALDSHCTVCKLFCRAKWHGSLSLMPN